ncbi:MAG: SDR family NAD(P)-dependent oxidoreductase [Crocinitomicaceae bacterium]|nr:SDR family NAD(P)-dependent oxidoreductase [Crocinitomicaceae bacterium]
MNDIPVTILILTRNEEKAISGCLDSLRRFMQIIVVDSNSTDLTSHISRLHGAEVVGFDWNGKYPKKKQWSMLLPQIKFDWILFVDADERVSENLADEIQSVINGSEHTRFTAYEIPLEYHFLGKRMLFGHQVKKIALINRHHSWFPEIEDLHIGNMWEVEGHYQPCTSGSVGKLSEKIIHQDPDPLYDYFARHNRYSDWEAENNMIQVNITALTQFTKLYLPGMIARKNGKILNVASTAAFVPGPTMAVYCATKPYVLSFSEALNNEVSHHGISVTALCPGATASGFSKTAKADKSALFSKTKLATSEEVAQFGYTAMIKGKQVAIHGFMNQFLAFIVRFTPRALVVKISRKVIDK